MRHIRQVVIWTACLLFVWSGSTWAFFETNKELVKSAKVTLSEAVEKAAEIAPGKAVEAQIGEEDDRVVYWIEVVDSKNATRTIYVDAETGNVVNMEKD
ncbi:PepSY domain-containing protein [Nitrospira sp. M1]